MMNEFDMHREQAFPAEFYLCEGAECGLVTEDGGLEACPRCGGTMFHPIEEEYISGYGWSTLGHAAEERGDWPLAAAYYARGAEQEYPLAQCALGWCYEAGQGVEQNWEKAIRLYRLSAEIGYPPAQCNLGWCYETGAGVEQDLEQAVAWYMKATLQNYGRGFYGMACCCEKAGDSNYPVRKAFGIFKLAEKSGLIDSELEQLKRLSARPRIQKLAHIFYLHSAEQGYAPGALHMAEHFDHIYYDRDADPAQKQNAQERRVHWYTVAADRGSVTAQFRLAYLCEKESGEPEKAFHYYRMGGQTGDHYLQYHTGRCYEYGIGTAVDLETAFDWYSRAAEQKDRNGLCALGSCYAHGKGTQIDLAKAVECYEKAANANIEEAMYALAECYAHGKGVAQDWAAAVKWYQKAAVGYHAQAMYCLGQCYELGRGVGKDFGHAKKWYQMAMELDHEEAARALARLNKKPR